MVKFVVRNVTSWVYFPIIHFKPNIVKFKKSHISTNLTPLAKKYALRFVPILKLTLTFKKAMTWPHLNFKSTTHTHPFKLQIDQKCLALIKHVHFIFMPLNYLLNSKKCPYIIVYLWIHKIITFRNNPNNDLISITHAGSLFTHNRNG